MGLEHIVVAADETEVSRRAVRAALAWANRAGARLTVLSVGQTRTQPALVTADARAAAPGSIDAIERWLAAEPAVQKAAEPPRIAEVGGVPSVEIARFAEESAADLLVLGRKWRSANSRLLVGDTADAVARRSRVPCLFVPGSDAAPDRFLVALDGTERGFTVLREACRLATALQATVDLVTVERINADEPGHLAQALPGARTEELARRLGSAAAALSVRRGDVVTEIIAEISARQAGVLILGYHRGGPPGMVEAGSVARQLAHRAPCAVLTIPL